MRINKTQLIPIGVTVWKDIEGYEEVDRGEPPRGSLIASEGRFGRHIIGRSGKFVPVKYRLGETAEPMWEEAFRSKSIVDRIKFLGKYGPLDSFRPAGAAVHRFETPQEVKKHSSRYYRDGKPYDRHQDLVESNFELIRRLGYCVEGNDRDGFVLIIGGRIRQVDLALFRDDQLMSLEVNSLREYLVYEMASEFGSTPSARAGLRICANPNCSNTIVVGGRRAAGALRSDAKYCGPSCRVNSHRLKERSKPAEAP